MMSATKFIAVYTFFFVVNLPHHTNELIFNNLFICRCLFINVFDITNFTNTIFVRCISRYFIQSLLHKNLPHKLVTIRIYWVSILNHKQRLASLVFLYFAMLYFDVSNEFEFRYFCMNSCNKLYHEHSFVLFH